MNAIEKAFARFGAKFVCLLLTLPAPLIKLLAGPKPKSAPELHPEALLIGRLAGIPRPGVKTGLAGLAKNRERLEIETAAFSASLQYSGTSEDRSVPGAAGELLARLYVPAGSPASGPLMVFFHGGGWMTGSLNSHDGVCKMLAEDSGVRILSVEYRLAPEHEFPAAADDCVAAYEYVVAHTAEFAADPARIAVGGDSAGGNLAAVVVNDACARSIASPAFQLLIYPVVDLSMTQPSYEQFGKGFYLTWESIRAFADAYVPEPEARNDPRAAPLHAESLAGVVPTYVATACADPLRDEGEEYAERLREAGVTVEFKRFPLLHGFVNMIGSKASRAASAELGEALRKGLAA